MDPIEHAQTLFAGRLAADPYFADVAVLQEQKGVTDADIEQALSVLNPQGGKIGACVVVLMPTLRPKDANAPSPIYTINLTVQVIDMPLLNLGEGGTGKSAAQIAQRVRQLLHLYSTGERSCWTFSGADPIPVESGRNSYGVVFAREAGDPFLAKASRPAATIDGTGPITVALSCSTPGASIRYTLDGSYPSALNAAAVLYTAPIAIAEPCTLLAVATHADHFASNLLSLDLTPTA